MADKPIFLHEVHAALRAYQDVHGRDAMKALMIRICGTSEIRQVPDDPTVRQKLIDAAAVGTPERPQAKARAFDASYVDGVWDRLKRKAV